MEDIIKGELIETVKPIKYYIAIVKFTGCGSNWSLHHQLHSNKETLKGDFTNNDLISEYRIIEFDKPEELNELQLKNEKVSNNETL